jgi:cell division septation protein DedD
VNYDEFDGDEASPKEIHLSNSKLLAIFLGAAVVCGAFFGFGYSVGKRAPVSAVATQATLPDAVTTTGNKPSAGLGSARPAQAAAPAPETAPVVTTATVEEPATAAPPVEAPVKTKAPEAETQPPAKTVVVRPTPVPVAAAPGGRTYVVQVAAVSHKGDADILVAALHRKGYQVSAVPGTDNLIHVQVGPFANQKDAATVSTQLSDDGYSTLIR